MKHLYAILAAGCIALPGAATAHEDTHKNAAPSSAAKEQQPWGIAGDPKAVRRIIRIAMSDDMRFTPDRVEVKRGETVRFVVTNAGVQLHEFVLGTKKELDEHAALMIKFPNMEHDAPYMAHVKPGRKGDVVWRFNRAGEFRFACLVAGHYQAGMRGTINVK